MSFFFTQQFVLNTLVPEVPSHWTTLPEVVQDRVIFEPIQPIHKFLVWKILFPIVNFRGCTDHVAELILLAILRCTGQLPGETDL